MRKLLIFKVGRHFGEGQPMSRAFLRLIMIKTGVSSRSAVVGKILTTQRSAELITSPLLSRANVNQAKVALRPGYQMQFAEEINTPVG